MLNPNAIMRELFGLLVDDPSLAFAILAWVAVGRWVLPQIAADTAYQAVIWVSGLMSILIENVYRRASRNR